VLQPSLNLSDDHFDGDGIVTTAWYDDVRVPLAWLDELEMHRLHRRQVLLDYFVQRSAALVRVALDPTNEPDVGVGIDEHFDIA